MKKTNKSQGMRVKKVPVIQNFIFVLSIFFAGNVLGAGDFGTAINCDSLRGICQIDNILKANRSYKAALKQEEKCIKDGTDPSECHDKYLAEAEKIKNTFSSDSADCVEAWEQCKGKSGFNMGIVSDFSAEDELTKKECDSLKALCHIAAALKFLDTQYDHTLALRSCVVRDGSPENVAFCLGLYSIRMEEARKEREEEDKACEEKYPCPEGRSRNSKTSILKPFESVNVYPNPSNGFFVVAFGENMKIINVLDYLGRNVKSPVIGNDNKIEVSIEESGIYFIEAVSTTGEKIRQKVIVQ